MKSRMKPPRPTDAELEILRVLWREGPSTVREVHSVLSQSRVVAYTTVLKFLQIMTEKGHVRRDVQDRSHVYEPCFAEEETQRRLLDDLIHRAFDGSAQKLVLSALSRTKATPEELRRIRRLLEDLDERKKEGREK